MSEKSREDIRFLASSPNRLKILNLICEKPRDLRSITDSVPKTRRSIQRDLSAFESKFWIEKTSGEYRITTYGRAIATQYADVMSNISLINQHKQLFCHLPSSDHLPDPRWLRDACITIADTDQPHAPLNHYLNGICESSVDTIRIISPVYSQSFRNAYTVLLERDVRIELLLDMTTATTARSMDLTEFASARRLDSFSIYECSKPIEFALAIADNCGFLGVFNEQNQFIMCVEFTDNAFFEWADDLYKYYWEQSRPTKLEDTSAIINP